MGRFLAFGLALLIVAAGAPPAEAQVVDPYAPQYYRGAPRSRAPQPAYRAPQGYYRGQPYYPGMLVYPAPQRQPDFSLGRLFGYEEEQRRAPRIAPRPKPRRPPAVAKQEKPKVDPTTHVVVFGDALADLTAQGLDDAFSDDPDVAVVRRAKADVSLAREPGELPRAIDEVLDGDQKITVAVVMLGTGERQPIREGDATLEPVSEPWKRAYRARVDAVGRKFQARGVPVVWIGVPPMKSDKASADYLAINDIYRESVERLGGTYVDIWPGFVDDENHYTATGPDVDGQPSRLRTGDGVLFTRAGARKAAHFADTEIKRIIEARRTGTAVAATPSAGQEALEGSAGAALPAPADPAATPTVPAPKPVAGPVLPLTGKPEVSPGGTLLTSRPRLEADPAAAAQKTLRDGVPTGPRPGRADDFRWPRS